MNRKILSRVSRPILSVVAIIYFLIDALFVSLLHPLVTWIGRLPIFPRMRRWIASIRPYPALALFLVPLVVLEPAKPVGTYLIAIGNFRTGVVVIVGAEILKIVVVERLFQINREKLLSIAAFAWVYYRIISWLDWLKQLPPWRFLQSKLQQLKTTAKNLALKIRHTSGRRPS
jgi:hypothetical protein